MNPTHVRLAATAIRKIREHGRAMQIVTNTTGPGEDADFDPYSVETTTTVTDTMGLQLTATEDEADGQRVRVGDRGYLFGSGAPITNDALVRDQGRDHAISVVMDIRPGDVLIGWQVWCRTS